MQSPCECGIEPPGSISHGVKFIYIKYNPDQRYADDTTIITEDPNDLELLTNKIKRTSAEVGLELNLAKTK